jgi:hypothetical protein
MEVNCHLNDEEMAEVLSHPASEYSRTFLAHLQLCDACTLELDRLRGLIESLEGAALEANQALSQTASRDFWEEQRAAIWRQILSGERNALRWLPVLAGALATVILAIGLGLRPLPRSVGSSEPKPDPDRQLLVDVEQLVESDGPEALEPAARLAQQIGGREYGSNNDNPGSLWSWGTSLPVTYENPKENE